MSPSGNFWAPMLLWAPLRHFEPQWTHFWICTSIIYSEPHEASLRPSEPFWDTVRLFLKKRELFSDFHWPLEFMWACLSPKISKCPTKPFWAPVTSELLWDLVSSLYILSPSGIFWVFMSPIEAFWAQLIFNSPFLHWKMLSLFDLYINF